MGRHEKQEGLKEESRWCVRLRPPPACTSCAGSRQGSIRKMREAAVRVIPTAADSYVTTKIFAPLPAASIRWKSAMRLWRAVGAVALENSYSRSFGALASMVLSEMFSARLDGEVYMHRRPEPLSNCTEVDGSKVDGLRLLAQKGKLTLSNTSKNIGI